MSEQHTPGPWRVLITSGWIQTIGDPYGHGSMHIADVRGWGHLTGRGGGCAFSEEKAVAIQEANARLIAAAPDLLAALRELLQLSDNWGDEIRDGALTLHVAVDAVDAALAAIAKAEDAAGPPPAAPQDSTTTTKML